MRVRNLRNWLRRRLWPNLRFQLRCRQLVCGIAIAASACSAQGQTALEQLNNASDEASLIGVHQQLGIPRGDIDGNGNTGFPDFLMISRGYGELGTGYSSGDINLDGIVDIGDYGILAANFGSEAYQPEPPVVPPQANLTMRSLPVSEGRELVVSNSTSAGVYAIEITSPSGGLTRTDGSALDIPDDATPFMFRLAANPNRAAWGSLGETALQGPTEFETGVSWDEADLTLRWVEPSSYKVHSAAVFSAGGSEPAGVLNERFVQAQTEAELIATHQELNVPRGEVNGDGLVDFNDYLIFTSNYGQENVGYAGGDFNLNGRVEIGDHAILSGNFGRQEYLPEPPSRPPLANPGLSVNDDGYVVISTAEGAEFNAIELSSSEGTLALDPDRRNRSRTGFPFWFESGQNNVALAGAPVWGAEGYIDGDLTLPVQASGNDLAIRWTERDSYDVYSLGFGEGDALTGRQFGRLPNEPLPEPDSSPNQGPSFIPNQGDDPLDQSALDSRFRTVQTETELLELHRETNTARGNVDGDWGVNLGDLYFIGGRYGQSAESYADGDLNLDGVVDFQDMAIVTVNFGTDRYSIEPGPQPAEANLGLSLNAEQQIVISSKKAVELGGVEIVSADNSLTYGDFENTGFLFPFILEHSEGSAAWVYGVGSVTLEGDLTTYVNSSSENLTINWFERSGYDVYSLAFGEGDEPTGNPPTEPGPREFPKFFTSEAGLEAFNNLDTSSGPIKPTNEFDGIEDVSELIAKQEELNLPRADITGDGKVDRDDALLLSISRDGNFGLNSTRGFAGGDLNLDGDKDFEDLAIMYTYLGTEGFIPDGEVTRVDLTASVNDDGLTVIESAGPVELKGIELQASNGTFEAQSEEAYGPFMSLEQSAADTLTWLNFGDATVSLDGEFVTDMLYEANEEGVSTEPGVPEFRLQWYQQGSSEVFSNFDKFENSAPIIDPTTSDPIPGDINGDGRVSFVDFLTLSQNYGREVTSLAEGDINGDGVVQFADFLVLSDNFGTTSAGQVSSVPEPTSGLMLTIGYCTALSFRSRRRRAT